MQGFSLLDLFPADLRAAKNPKRRKRRRKRTRKRRNIRRRRRRTRTSIPRRMQPHHPLILPQIGIRGSWVEVGHHHQWKTGGRIRESHVVMAGARMPLWHLLAFQNPFFTPGITMLASPLSLLSLSRCPRRHHRRKTQQHSEASRHGSRRRHDTESSNSSGDSGRGPARRRSRSRDGRGRHPSPRRKGRKRSRSRSPPARGVRQRHDTDSED